ncbi:Art5p PWA37_004052 [Arxiozyma heterogenica]|uniref:Art5p n=1 Tax=Arxiozyma heterogenica TaxID=278026 RepID=UPI002EE5EAA7
MFSISSSNKQIIRIKDHDILVDSPYKDTILIYGNPLENDQIPLNGTINFIIDVDYLIIKKICLRMIGQYKLEFIQIGTKSFHNNPSHNISVTSSSLASPSPSSSSSNINTVLTRTSTTNPASTVNPTGSTSITSGSIEINGNNSMNTTNGVAVVKENSIIFECLWNNLLANKNGEIITNITNNNSTTTTTATNSNSTNIKMPYSKFKLKRNNSNYNNHSNNNTYNSNSSSIIIDITPDTVTTINIPELNKSKAKIRYKFHRGKYSIPFKLMLPNDIPETIEGLQSGSILYTLESNIECKYANDFGNKSTSLIHLNLSRNHNSYSHTNNNTSDNNREDDTLAKVYNPILSQYHRYKYLRILRTLSSNNLNVDEEMSIQNTLPDRLQYEIKIPSRAIPIGDSIPIQIKIFPFSKQVKLIKISVHLAQKYYIKDSKGTIYDNEIIIFKKSIKNFGSLLLEDNKLFKEIDFISKIDLPKDLKSLTQSCSIRDEKFIQVLHKLKFQLKFKRYDTNVKQWKNFQINATIPLILYISPYVNIKGRLVYYDQMTGKIHFRPGELIDLFNAETNCVGVPHLTNLRSLQDYSPLFENIHGQQQQHLLNDIPPPPTYEEYNRDQLIIPDHHLTNRLRRMLITDNIPSYEQATSSNHMINT